MNTDNITLAPGQRHPDVLAAEHEANRLASHESGRLDVIAEYREAIWAALERAEGFPIYDKPATVTEQLYAWEQRANDGGWNESEWRGKAGYLRQLRGWAVEQLALYRFAEHIGGNPTPEEL